MPSEDQLRLMLMAFKLADLQLLLGFAGRNKQGSKPELLERALDLLKLRTPQIQNKIAEIFLANQRQKSKNCKRYNMMGPGGNPLNYSAAYQQMLSLASYSAAQQAALSQSRNPYVQGGAFPASPAAFAAAAQASYGMKPGTAIPQPANVKMKKLPFYDIHGELLQPTSLLPQGSSRFQEAQFNFQLSAQQATDIASNRDIRMGSKLDYLFQIQLRFCPLDTAAEQGDEFPPSICVQVNNKMCQLPNPIPTNKPNVEPKRPPKPVNITQLCKLSPTLVNTVNIKWAADFGKGWVVGIWLVKKLTSENLLDRLNQKGTRKPEFTQDIIIKKLSDDEDEIATTNLKVTVACPLGKMRMTIPCRPSTCDHLQCFDAMLFLQMNERKPTWQCPVCDSPALYDNLMVDGYFLDVIKSPKLPDEENEIILNQDGSWHPVPKEDEDAKKKKKPKDEEKEDKEEVDLVDLSDDDGEGGSGGKSSAAAATTAPAPAVSNGDGAESAGSPGGAATPGAPATTNGVEASAGTPTPSGGAATEDEDEGGAAAAASGDAAGAATNGSAAAAPAAGGEIECIDLE